MPCGFLGQRVGAVGELAELAAELLLAAGDAGAAALGLTQSAGELVQASGQIAVAVGDHRCSVGGLRPGLAAVGRVARCRSCAALRGSCLQMGSAVHNGSAVRACTICPIPSTAMATWSWAVRSPAASSSAPARSLRDPSAACSVPSADLSSPPVRRRLPWLSLPAPSCAWPAPSATWPMPSPSSSVPVTSRSRPGSPSFSLRSACVQALGDAPELGGDGGRREAFAVGLGDGVDRLDAVDLGHCGAHRVEHREVAGVAHVVVGADQQIVGQGLVGREVLVERGQAEVAGGVGWLGCALVEGELHRRQSQREQQQECDTGGEDSGRLSGHQVPGPCPAGVG